MKESEKLQTQHKMTDAHTSLCSSNSKIDAIECELFFCLFWFVKRIELVTVEWIVDFIAIVDSRNVDIFLCPTIHFYRCGCRLHSHRFLLSITNYCNVSKCKSILKQSNQCGKKSNLIIWSRKKHPANGFFKEEKGSRKWKGGKKNCAIHYYEYEAISDDSDTCFDNNGCQVSSLTPQTLYSFINV